MEKKQNSQSKRLVNPRSANPRLADFRNVGKATLEDLSLLGIHSVEELSKQDPTELFHWWFFTKKRKLLQKKGKIRHVV